eukprot:Opistho-1_new@98931
MRCASARRAACACFGMPSRSVAIQQPPAYLALYGRLALARERIQALIPKYSELCERASNVRNAYAASDTREAMAVRQEIMQHFEVIDAARFEGGRSVVSLVAHRGHPRPGTGAPARACSSAASSRVGRRATTFPTRGTWPNS